MDHKQLTQQASVLFSKRTTLNLLWQEIADNFYVERADFAYQRYLGMDYAAHLSDSYPLLVRRELGDQLGAMLRPTQTEWNHMATQDPRRETVRAKRWMQWAEGIQRRAMYDRNSLFTEATKQGDHDYAAFGQAVLSLRLNRARDGLLYRCWHLRDCVWKMNVDNKIGFVARRWKPELHNLVAYFPGKLADKWVRLAEKEPFREVECLHISCEQELYSGPFDVDSGSSPEMQKRRRARFPFVSLYILCEDDVLLEATPSASLEYIIPRWQTVSGSQYAFSPATVAALPAARLIQAMATTLLEAGEKAVYPPMVAVDGTIRSDMALYAGGTTWIDKEYDERTGAALRPIEQDLRGLPEGKEMVADARSVLRALFYLDKLSLPTNRPAMTAYEVGQYVAQYIRTTMPLFEPIELNYNGALCEETFNLLQRNGAFGSPEDMPDELRNTQITWRFESPLHEAIEQQKVQKFTQASELIAQAVAHDPASNIVLDWGKSLHDALLGGGTPADWVREQDEIDEIQRKIAQQKMAEAGMAAAEQASNVAANLASAGKDARAALGGQPAPAQVPAGAPA